MGLYSTLTDAELTAKRAELLSQMEQLATGGVVTKMAGEGRSIEMSGGNLNQVRRLYNACIEEIDDRVGGCGGHAIGVSF